MFDVLIVGGGPAALTAAIYSRRAGKSVLIVERMVPGGQIALTNTVENYPGIKKTDGMTLATMMFEHAQSLGTQFVFSDVLEFSLEGKVKKIRTHEGTFEGKVIILCLGASAKQLNLENEKKFLGRGVSYCATCDGKLYEHKKIAVICNDPKFEHEVEYLAELAAEVQYFPTFESRVQADNVTVSREIPARITGDKSVQALELRSGERLQVDGVFCLRNAITPAHLFPGIQIENGHIAVDRAMATNFNGCFACGDCTGRPYQYAKAVGEGNVAAHSVIKYLSQM